jgi:hypothetical protein
MRERCAAGNFVVSQPVERAFYIRVSAVVCGSYCDCMQYNITSIDTVLLFLN